MNRTFLGIAFCLAAALAAPFLLGDYGARVLNTAVIASVAVMGLNFAFGYAGLISLSHASFVGLGAYGLALLTTRLGFSPWLAAPIAIALTGATAYLMGRIVLKLKGHYLALATLGLNVSLTIVASNWVDLTGGTNGISNIPPLNIAGYVLADERGFYWFAIAVAAVLAWLAVRIRNSHVGRAMIAVRDDELATAMTGLSVAQVKVSAFTLSGLYAGIAGCLFAVHMKFISPEDFGFAHSITYLAMLVVGGEGSIVGAILGALAVTLLPEALRGLGNAYLLVFGLLVLLVLVLLPKGLVGLWTASVRQARPKRQVAQAVQGAKS